MELPPGSLPEDRHERRLGEPRHLAYGRDSQAAEFRRRLRADPPQALDRERMEKRQLPVRWHDEQAVGLRDAACDLGEELGPRHTDGERQADVLEHVAP